MLTGRPSTFMARSVPWSRLKPRRKYWLALPSPLCWVAMSPGTNSSSSAGRDMGRRFNCAPNTRPSVADCGSPVRLLSLPRTTISSTLLPVTPAAWMVPLMAMEMAAVRVLTVGCMCDVLSELYFLRLIARTDGLSTCSGSRAEYKSVLMSREEFVLVDYLEMGYVFDFFDLNDEPTPI